MPSCFFFSSRARARWVSSCSSSRSQVGSGKGNCSTTAAPHPTPSPPPTRAAEDERYHPHDSSRARTTGVKNTSEWRGRVSVHLSRLGLALVSPSPSHRTPPTPQLLRPRQPTPRRRAHTRTCSAPSVTHDRQVSLALRTVIHLSWRCSTGEFAVDRCGDGLSLSRPSTATPHEAHTTRGGGMRLILTSPLLSACSASGACPASLSPSRRRRSASTSSM